MRIWPFVLRAAVTGALLSVVSAATAAGTLPPGFDQRVDDAMRSRDVPGMAIAVVKGGEIVHARGYGVRRLGAPTDAWPLLAETWLQQFR